MKHEEKIQQREIELKIYAGFPLLVNIKIFLKETIFTNQVF